ncbi:DEKNAAC103225 [Brettanomyces naardenensis]|uniref:DEKNAAC103225 n=1 Tax=Brettanomyces naardenensis TaxID=13370 RepID=A0A448YMS5_BRENA|nr:DEKNAAC103225 [Brettanomyces naardenensis]
MTHYATKDKEQLKVSSPLTIEDRVTQKEIFEYLKSSGYDKFVTTRDLHHWWRFSGSAVWLPNDDCYLMVTRFVYAKGRREKPVLSLLRMQLFDSEWKELLGKRLRYVDVSFSDVTLAMEKYIDSNHDESMLDSISLKFPTFFDVKFGDYDGGSCMGAEDPRVTYRENKVMEGEPMVIFNMLNKDKDRLMNIGFPLRKPDIAEGVRVSELRYLKKDGLGDKLLEKNWSPFFEPEDTEFKEDSLGTAHMLYDFQTLTILKCVLDSGICQECLQKQPDKLPEPDRNIRSSVYLRGGTNLVPVPDILMLRILEDQNRMFDGITFACQVRMWFGIAKTHAKGCGCGTATYRPSIFVVSKVNEEYRLDLIGRSTELGMEVLSWEGDTTDCLGGANVLGVNSIPFWDIQKDGLDFKDYMAITVSESDRNVKMLLLKNVANYLVGLYRQNSLEKLRTDPMVRLAKATDCTLRSAHRHCVLYSQTHKASND